MSEISGSRLRELEKAESKLQALEAGGVDNWQFYDVSLEEWNKQDRFEELEDTFIAGIDDILVDAEVEYPAGMDAGSSVTLDDIELRKLFHSIIKEYNDIKGI